MFRPIPALEVERAERPVLSEHCILRAVVGREKEKGPRRRMRSSLYTHTAFWVLLGWKFSVKCRMQALTMMIPGPLDHVKRLLNLA